MSGLRGRVYGYAVSVVIVAAMLYPLQTNPPRDSFPLSTFPMFSKARPGVIEIGHVVGIGLDEERPIPPGMVASGEVLQAKVAIRATIRRGRAAAIDLCKQVAKRVAQDASFAWVKRVEVRTDRYQVAGYFSGSRKPVSSQRHARCIVLRDAATRGAR